MTSSTFTVLPRKDWEKLAAAHEKRASRYANPYVERRNRGLKHPVEDFLFTYYTLKPAQLKRWHPGAGVVLLDAPEYASQKFYRTLSAPELEQLGLDTDRAHRLASHNSAVTVDIHAFLEKRGTAVDFTREILGNTAAKPGYFGCFGMHEWAMAYKSVENNIRHDYLDLRLGAEGTDAVVESHKIRCSHFDAFRFFMPQATPMNELQPTRETQRVLEQPACLHANMDVYKWAYKLLPLVSSELLMDAFELAWQVRELDMKAAPYDLVDWGYEPVKVETAEGKAEYVKIQRQFALRSVQIRNRLLQVVVDYPTSLNFQENYV
ncbi:3-methyladenine DNA glycosylase [Rothia sp. ZJ932]|uniref:3-methyladenine DNA glycosylase n=1 Tax=Rothia sp. ZJ932 TaxID=2810516 RepID=UPI0019674BA1|nr:3-methyladenine DNA glycosylase [Rothia sp. ZJ932]QRZ61394.1 3-methyladenine DNA glycosylase [Rothia sp. ZJ932]